MNKKTIKLDKDYFGPETFTIEKLNEVFNETPSYIMPNIRYWIEDNNREKKFCKEETITVPSDKKDYLEIAGNDIEENKKNEISISPYDAWTLTKDGYLRRGSTGFFKDENGLFILKDGRRASYDHLVKIDELHLRIGDLDAQKGLNDILKREDIPVKDFFQTTKLLNEINITNLM